MILQVSKKENLKKTFLKKADKKLELQLFTISVYCGPCFKKEIFL
jgi:hypothetical protein